MSRFALKGFLFSQSDIKHVIETSKNINITLVTFFTGLRPEICLRPVCSTRSEQHTTEGALSMSTGIIDCFSDTLNSAHLGEPKGDLSSHSLTHTHKQRLWTRLYPQVMHI